MPTYGYECLDCENGFEVFQSIKDDPLTICESCGGALRKKIYPVGIAFKGAGFYVNDYAAKAPPKDAGAESKSETPAADKSATTPETKSDAPKTEAKPAVAAPATKSEATA